MLALMLTKKLDEFAGRVETGSMISPEERQAPCEIRKDRNPKIRGRERARQASGFEVVTCKTTSRALPFSLLSAAYTHI